MKKLIKKNPRLGIKLNFLRFLKYSREKKEHQINRSNFKVQRKMTFGLPPIGKIKSDDQMLLGQVNLN